MIRVFILTALFSLILFVPNSVASESRIKIEIEIPKIQSDPYHRPYVAVWLETPKRKGKHTLAFWREQEEWFKDLRQWWRKIGRKNKPNYDAASGATRKPGKYTLSWDGTLSNNLTLPAGDYVLHFESVREQGGREYLRQKVTLGTEQKQSFQLQGKTELGIINIWVN